MMMWYWHYLFEIILKTPTMTKTSRYRRLQSSTCRGYLYGRSTVMVNHMKQPIMHLLAQSVKWKMCLYEWEVERGINEHIRLSELFREVVLDALGERGGLLCAYILLCVCVCAGHWSHWLGLRSHFNHKFTETWGSESVMGIDSNFLFKAQKS